MALIERHRGKPAFQRELQRVGLLDTAGKPISQIEVRLSLAAEGTRFGQIEIKRKG